MKKYFVCCVFKIIQPGLCTNSYGNLGCRLVVQLLGDLMELAVNDECWKLGTIGEEPKKFTFKNWLIQKIDLV